MVYLYFYDMHVQFFQTECTDSSEPQLKHFCETACQNTCSNQFMENIIMKTTVWENQFRIKMKCLRLLLHLNNLGINL